MILTWLELDGFRSYQSSRVRPETGINVLVGENGSGKTNLVEAIHYLGHLRSMRGVPDEALIAVNRDRSVIRGEFRGESREVIVEVEIQRRSPRRVRLNGKRPARYGDVTAAVAVLAFLPDDLDLVKRGPSQRRGYLDVLGRQLWPVASGEQRDYDQAVRQRNALLRDHGADTDLRALGVWDQRVAESGARVIARRLEVLARLSAPVADMFADLIGPGASLTWQYRMAAADLVEPGADPVELEATIGEGLRRRRDRDLRQRSTSVGPHRDEPRLVVDGRDSRTMVSQGEQRALALALRLGAYEVLNDHFGAPPILLLDDVYSEFDPIRSERVSSLLPKGQVFITTAHPVEVPAEGCWWEVTTGSITRKDAA